MKQNLNELAKKLVEFGQKSGSTETQISINDVKRFSVDIREQNIEKLTEAGARSLSVKVIVDGRKATANSSDFTQSTLENLVKNAIERAKYSGVDEFNGLADKEESSVTADDLKIYDESIQKISPEEKIKLAMECEKVALSDSRIKKSSGAGCSTSFGTTFLATSKGINKSYKFSNIGLGVYLQAGEEDNMFEDGWWESACNYKNLVNPEKIANKAIDNVTRLIGAKKIETQKVPVIFEPQMTARILGFLSGCLSGKAIYMNQSFLAGKLGEKIAHENFHVIDDPLMPSGHGSRPYDSEGVPSRLTDVIEKGVLNSYLLDTYSAKKLGSKTTGHSGGSSNFYLKKGEYSPEDIIKSVDNGLLLTRTIGQGTVPTSGDISTGAYGIWIENGKLAYPVANITISGNLGTMLKDLKMIGNDLEFNRSTVGPTIKVEEMTVSGL